MWAYGAKSDITWWIADKKPSVVLSLHKTAAIWKLILPCVINSRFLAPLVSLPNKDGKSWGGEKQKKNKYEKMSHSEDTVYLFKKDWAVTQSESEIAITECKRYISFSRKES